MKASSPRIAYVTAGTVGAGHFVRGRAVGRALERSSFAGTYRMFGPRLDFPVARRAADYEAVEIRADARLRDPVLAPTADLGERLTDYRPDLLIVDLFWAPAHYLLPYLGCEAWLLVRLCPRAWLVGSVNLRFDPRRFDRVIAIEPLAEGYLHDDPVTHRVPPVVVTDPPEARTREEVRERFGVAPGADLEVVAHAGEAGELEELRQRAGPAAIRLDLRDPEAPFPAAEWLAACDRLHLGAGYNSYWEACRMGYRDRARFTAFLRRIDRQEMRLDLPAAAAQGENGADVLASWIA